MVDLPLHPLFIHMPLAITTLMPLYYCGLIFFPSLFNNTGVRIIGAIIWTLTSALGVVSYFTGQADREFSMASGELLGLHQDMAFYWMIGALILLGFLSFQLFIKKSRTVRWDIAIGLISLALLALIISVGHSGAEITYG